MSYIVDIQPEAEAEIREAYQYYEAQSQGLGSEFLRALDAAVELIRRHPQGFQVVEGEVRRVLLRRFPYGVFYLLDEQTIVVIACFHASRDPQEWQRRL